MVGVNVAATHTGNKLKPPQTTNLLDSRITSWEQAMSEEASIFAKCQKRIDAMETTMSVPPPLASQDHTHQYSHTDMTSRKRKATDNDLETNFLCAKRQLREIDAKQPTAVTVAMAPVDVAFQLFQENGYNMTVEDHEQLVQQLPFRKPTSKMVQEYKPDKISLVRKMDMKGVRALHGQGESFDACNRFGESLIHMACRRGCKEMVEFLVNEAKVSIFVRDDYGRTMLHDAFWTAEPNFALAAFLIKEAPEFLCVKDVRGHTPLNYVRKGDWSSWCNFLIQNKELLVPRYWKQDKKTGKDCL
jgi:hypothetical protein